MLPHRDLGLSEVIGMANKMFGLALCKRQPAGYSSRSPWKALRGYIIVTPTELARLQSERKGLCPSFPMLAVLSQSLLGPPGPRS